MPTPYATVSEADLTLRDRLALDRTVLANERTLLAYVRTALALLAGGVTLLHLVDEPWAVVLGGVALPLSVVVGAYGAWRFGAVRRRLRAVG
ncbi:YidH family protein [Rubrivirga sp.]|uniref:YidH family protein n=1 Tax=Rubrivirga sp. TaxID=1885344 RepID=UPI003B51A2FD